MRQSNTRASTGTNDSGERTSNWRELVPPVWLAILILAYTVTYSALSIVKHNTFHSATFDLGIMSQVIWNTAQGRIFEISLDRALDTELIGSYLGNHVRPIFLLIAPFYRLWPDPRLLRSGDDVFLGEAIRQQGWEFCNLEEGVAIDTEPRRGHSDPTNYPKQRHGTNMLG